MGMIVATGYDYFWSCGRSSGVERNLAKVEVVSSNLIARSIYRPEKKCGNEDEEGQSCYYLQGFMMDTTNIGQGAVRMNFGSSVVYLKARHPVRWL